MSLYFPDLKVQWGLTVGWQTKTDIEEAQGREQRRRRYPRYDSTTKAGGVRRVLSGDLQYLNYTDRYGLRDFILSLDGPYTPFYIYAWDPQQWTAYPIATADGMATQFDVPFKDPEQVVIRDNGVAVPVYTGGGSTPSYMLVTAVYAVPQLFIYATGTDPASPDLTPPIAGHKITAYLIGRQRIAVRLADDKQQEKFVTSAQVLAVRTINVIEVLGETP